MTAPTIPSPRTPEVDPWTLVGRAQGGDVQAFAELYDLHNVAVYNYLWLRCGNVSLAQDWAQDVWERALRGIGGLRRGPVPPLAWLLRIARNRSIDYYRSGRYRLEVVSDDLAGAADRADPAEDPALTVMERATSAVMLAAVRQLTAQQQEAIALTYFVGLSSIEAGAVMGIAGTAVKALTMRGRRALAVLLAGER